MFFELKTGRPRSFYMEHAKKVLSIEAPMVVFCDESTHADLAALREDRPTTFFVKPIHEYDYYSTLLPIIAANRITAPSSDSRNTPEYFLLTMFKFHALQIASQAVRSDHYMWLDIGAAHVARSVPESIYPILARPRPGIACCYIHYRPHEELYPIQNYVTGKCGIAATVITVQASHVSRFYTCMMSMMYEQLMLGVGHAEEQVMVYVYDQHPEWFSLYFGDYYSVATNYHKTVEDHACVQYNFILNAAASGNHALAEEARNSIV
jgi:hypothetical protein